MKVREVPQIFYNNQTIIIIRNRHNKEFDTNWLFLFVNNNKKEENQTETEKLHLFVVYYSWKDIYFS